MMLKEEPRQFTLSVPTQERLEKYAKGNTWLTAYIFIYIVTWSMRSQ